ncbi:MAG: glycosyltransferase [Aggregatilineales bacterium]
MQILMTFIGGNGHFQPMVPLAQTAQAAGHTITVVCGQSMLACVQNTGFDAIAIGKKNTGIVERIPLRPVDMAREMNDLHEKFARQGARNRAVALLPVCETRQPNLIICDELDFGAMIVAEHLNIPHVTVLVIAAGGFVLPEIVAEPLNKIRAEYKLSPDPMLKMLSQHLMLSPFPEQYRNPAYPLPENARLMRPPLPQTDSVYPIKKHFPDAPVLYFTLGTIFNTESGDLFGRVLTALQTLEINVIVTTGKHINPSEFSTQPPHIHITNYIPQAELLPHCDLMISHGGSGSVMGALSHGLPMLIIPMGADQPLNAERCKTLGAGKMLDAVTANPSDIRDAINDLLQNASYHQAAKMLRDDIHAMPDVTTIMPLLENLI